MDQYDVKILLVDDEEEILAFLSYVLEKEGFKVMTSTSGVAALKLANSFVPDIIILDVMMPEMDGIETCTRLKNDSVLEDSLIAFLSARNDDLTKISGLEVGADDFIEKPIKPQLFVAKIRSLVRRKMQQQTFSGKRSYNDLKINLDKRKVKRNGETINLTKIEYELLLLFVGSPDKIFTREEIYLRVWGSHIIVGDRTLDVHVRNLRKKIGKKNIQTSKGIGYSFNLDSGSVA